MSAIKFKWKTSFLLLLTPIISITITISYHFIVIAKFCDFWRDLPHKNGFFLFTCSTKNRAKIPNFMWHLDVNIAFNTSKIIVHISSILIAQKSRSQPNWVCKEYYEKREKIKAIQPASLKELDAKQLVDNQFILLIIGINIARLDFCSERAHTPWLRYRIDCMVDEKNEVKM